jgi:hypothetical protein
MKRHLAAAVLVGLVLAGSFAATAWATHTVGYAPCCGVSGSFLTPGDGYESGTTGLGWVQNYMKWTDPEGGTPNMCSNYLDSSEHKLLTDKCSGSGIEDDARYEGNYAGAYCWASASNNYDVELSNAWPGTGYGCWATHN